MKTMNKVIAAMMMMAITTAMPAMAGNKNHNDKKDKVVVVNNGKKESHFDKNQHFNPCFLFILHNNTVIVSDGLTPFIGKRYGLFLLQVIKHQYRQAPALHFLRINVKDFLFQTETLVA